MNPHKSYYRGKKVIVTGPGFKGAWLAALLVELGAQVFVTQSKRHSPLSSYHILHLKDRVTVLSVDVTNADQVLHMLASVRPAVIFHLAAISEVPTAIQDPSLAYRVNFGGTLNVVEGLRLLQLETRLVVASTDHVFGNCESTEMPLHGLPVTHPLGWNGAYDTSKAAMELMLRSMHHAYSSPSWKACARLRGEIAISRAANVIGPGDANQRRVVPLFIQAGLRGRIPLLYRKNGRQFITIEDVTTGYLLAGCVPLEAFGQVVPTLHFALADYGVPTPFITMEGLAEIVAAVTGSLVDAEGAIDYAPGENKVQALDTRETARILSWRPSVNLGLEIERLVEWYRAQDSRSALERMAREQLDRIHSAFSNHEPQ